MALMTAVAMMSAGGASAAAPSLTLDLASPPPAAEVTRIYGHGLENDGELGVPVCGGWDCDGDGHADTAFAQFLGDPLGRTGAGEVTVVFGDGTIGWTADSAVPQAGILRIAGAQPHETAGAEVWIDDVTGDGLGDLIIGRQNYSVEFPPPTAPRIGAGGLTILVGSAQWRTHAATLDYLDLAAPPEGMQVITFAGPSDYDRLGIWMRTGDIDGDGVADILVGADEVDGEGQSLVQNQGAAFVIRGGRHLLQAPEVVDLGLFGQPSFPSSLTGHVAWIDPPSGLAGAHFGATVQVGDLDGNRRAEVLVAATLNRAGAQVRLPGAPNGTGRSTGGTRDGTVYIVWDENFPPGPWPADHRFEATNPPLGDHTVIDGDASAQSFGEEMLAGLDYSGDGFPDLMVGDLVADPLGRFNAGRGYVIYSIANLRGAEIDLDSPPAGTTVTRIVGSVDGAISSDTALHGDFDGDGLGDLAIGSPHDVVDGRLDAGSVHILYGQPGGWPALIDLSPVTLPAPSVMRIAHIKGAKGALSFSSRGDTLCYSAAAGDIDGDGRPDLIVNEMAGDGSGGTPRDVGNMLVINAGSLLGPPSPSLAFSSGRLLDFGSISPDGAEAVEEITMTNSGLEAVTILALGLTGPNSNHFSILSDSGQSALSPGESRILTVSYLPPQVGRSAAAISVHTTRDLHPVGVALAGRGVNDTSLVPGTEIRRVGRHAVLELESQFGTDYVLTRSENLMDAPTAELFRVQGTGRILYLTDQGALDRSVRAFYRVRVERR